MNTHNILIIGNITQPPYVNNLLAPVRAFERAGRVRVIEPYQCDGFQATGGMRPTAVPLAAVQQSLVGFTPDLVVCLAGGLYLPHAARRLFAADTLIAGFALSDPIGLEASLQITPTFDLYYTSDPQTVPVYADHGLTVRRCDPAVDAQLFQPMELEPDCDIIFYGKWTPYRDAIVRALARHFQVNVHTYRHEKNWSVPSLPPLDNPRVLCTAINRARIALEITRVENAPSQFQGTSRITNRAQTAAACGVVCLIDTDAITDYFEPKQEIEVFQTPEDAVRRAQELLADDVRREEMGRRARARVVRNQTWDARVQAFLEDIAALRSQKQRG